MRTMYVPLMQSNKYANWARCPLCGHTHATITNSATCCLTCKERFNTMVTEQKSTTPTMVNPANTTANRCSGCYTKLSLDKMGNFIISILFRMTPAYLNAITQAQEELNAKRSGNPNGPWGEYNPRPESTPIASAVVHLGSLKAKTSDEHYCMLDSGAHVLVIPWKPGMKSEKTMCTLVGDNRTEGLIVSKLSTHSRVHLIVAVKEALVSLANFLFSSNCELSSFLEACVRQGSVLND